MDLMEAMRCRHSVRRYTDRQILPETACLLQEEIERCNQEGSLHMQLILEEPEAFGSFLAHYGLFRGVRNYIAVVGRPADDLEERAGYFGERVVLEAQRLGLNTCWVAATYSKRNHGIQVLSGERIVCVIAVGYGANQGRPHRNKRMESCYRVNGKMPDWFRRGVEAAMLAPTAINQQKFCFVLQDAHTVCAKAGVGACTKIDLGIAKYHFEIGAAPDRFCWAD